VVSKQFADPKPNPKSGPGPLPKSFHELGRQAAVKAIGFATLAGGQLLVEGAKRSAGQRLTFSRANVSAQGQTYKWENLKPPVLVEDFAELAARLATLPPSALRPRRPGEDFHVLPVARTEAAGFDGPSQTTVATLYDAADRVAYLHHPFTTRGQGGTEALLARFAAGESLKYVAGSVRQSPHGLMVHPVLCVFETAAGRVGVQPWLDAAPTTTANATATLSEKSQLPLQAAIRDCHRACEDLLTLGLRRTDAGTLNQWADLQRQFESVGLVRLANVLAQIGAELRKRQHTVRWEPRPAAESLLRLLVLLRLLRDVGEAD
jgi:hypothetical protein